MLETDFMFDFYIPTHLLFGAGKIHTLHKCEMPGTKALIVITNGKSTIRNGYLDTVKKELDMAGCSYTVFDGVYANPVTRNIQEGAESAKENGCDFVIGLGGGSAIDACKAIALMATNPGNVWDYIQMGSGGKQKVQRKPLPVIAVTTTAGTGTEADSAFVVTNEETKEKIGFYHSDLFPVISVADAEMMVTVPPKFTAYQGFDALFHSIEGYICNKPNIFCDMLIETVIQNVAENLPIAVADGANLTARERVAFGNTLSGFQMSTGNLTAEHSLEHAMSAFHEELPHGAGLVMISIAYYHHLTQVPELQERFIKMAKLMGKGDADKAEDFIDTLQQLIEACGIGDLKMSQYGISPDEFPKFVKNARSTMGSKFENEYLELTDKDCIKIYQESYH